MKLHDFKISFEVGDQKEELTPSEVTSSNLPFPWTPEPIQIASSMAVYLQAVERDHIDRITFWQLYERAARASFGEDILVKNTLYFTRKAQDISFAVRIVSKESEPREVTRTVLDIIIKEYANGGKEGQDQTILKASNGFVHNRDNFFTTEGIDFGFGDNIAAQIICIWRHRTIYQICD